MQNYTSTNYFAIQSFVSSREANHNNHNKQTRSRNPSNCINIKMTNPANKTHGSLKTYVPSLFLWNVMSLAPKIDELHCIANHGDLDCICITESWLQSHIHNNIVDLEGFNIIVILKDREEGIHGGVCTYIKESINFTILQYFDDPSLDF